MAIKLLPKREVFVSLVVTGLLILQFGTFFQFSSCREEEKEDQNSKSSSCIPSSRQWIQQEQDTTPFPMIPAHIHMIHVGPGIIPAEGGDPIPQIVLDFAQAWRDVHANSTREWKVTIWDNTMIRQHFEAEVVNHLASIPLLAWASDVLRARILQEFGGIYLDTDIWPFRPLDPLLKYLQQYKQGAFAVSEIPFNVTKQFVWQTNKTPWALPDNVKCRLACNAVIGSIQQHPALQDFAKTVWDNTLKIIPLPPPPSGNNNDTTSKIPVPKFPRIKLLKREIVRTTGPSVWIATVQKHRALAKNNKTHDADDDTASAHSVEILQSSSFYPCHFKTAKRDCHAEYFQSNPNVFAMHMWAKTWKQ